MIDNKFGFYPDLDLDLDKLREISMRRLTDTVPGMKAHQRPVDEEPYLIEVRKRYSFLNKIYNIYKTPATKGISVHIDSGRHCALNIPIENTENTHTVFYEILDDQKTINIPELVYDLVKAKVSEIYRFTLTRPTIINTKIPHSVIGNPYKDRIVMSWSVDSRMTYEDLRSLLQTPN